MQVTIDPHSGFCFGVTHAIEVAERELHDGQPLFCLGDIVHNHMEVDRLRRMGLKIIDHGHLESLHDCKVLIRAHGEPPETYQIALRNNIELIDASCPIVLHLQNVIRLGYLEMKKKNGQVVIYGRDGHAEVNGLKGQTDGTAIVIGGEEELYKIDFSRPVRCYSQTTKSAGGYQEMIRIIRERMEETWKDKPVDFEWHDSVCRQVSNRSGQLKVFAARFDSVVFVSGRKSSNGLILYQVCKDVNPRTILVSGPGEIEQGWFENVRTVGICVDSTPMWLMEEVGKEIEKIIS